MPASLVDSLCEWADVQSLLLRTTEADVSFKPAMARQMLVAAIALYRWFRAHQSAVKRLSLILPAAGNTSVDDLLTAERLNAAQSGGRLTSGMGTEEADLMEETDAGGEASDNDDDGDAAAGAGGPHYQADPDTENDEAANGGGGGAGPLDDLLDDSDAEDNNMGFGL